MKQSSRRARNPGSSLSATCATLRHAKAALPPATQGANTTPAAQEPTVTAVRLPS